MCPCSVTEFSKAPWENLRMTSSNCRFYTFLCLGKNKTSFAIHNDGLYHLWNKRDNLQIDTFCLRRHPAKLRVSEVHTTCVFGPLEKRLSMLGPTAHFVNSAAIMFGLRERFFGPSNRFDLLSYRVNGMWRHHVMTDALRVTGLSITSRPLKWPQYACWA